MEYENFYLWSTISSSLQIIFLTADTLNSVVLEFVVMVAPTAPV